MIRLGTEDALKSALLGLGLSGRLNTACIERVNLTVRDARGCAGSSELGDGEACPTVAYALGMVARLLPWMSRPHASLRVALIQPREGGGKRLAQRFRQRTEAPAVGSTNRRWTAGEVLCYPLPPIPRSAF